MNEVILHFDATPNFNGSHICIREVSSTLSCLVFCDLVVVAFLDEVG